MFLIIVSTGAFLILENVKKANFNGMTDSEKFTMLDSLALSLGLLIQNAYAIEMCKMSSRILYLAIWASTLVLFAYYTCDMTSRLTGPSVIPVRSYDDVKKYGYKVIVGPAGVHAEYLKNVAPQIFENSMKVHNLFQAVQLMSEHPNHLYYGYDSEAVMSKDVVSLSIDETILLNSAFAFQLNSEFTDLFNYYLRKMGEAGNIQRLRDPI